MFCGLAIEDGDQGLIIRVEDHLLIGQLVAKYVYEEHDRVGF